MDGIDELAESTSPESEVVGRLRSIVHRRLCKIRRLHFTIGEKVVRDYGAVELTFDRTILLDVGGDGESLVARDGPWIDPFGSPVSAENQAWIAAHGKWAAFDVSTVPEYAQLVGDRVRTLRLLRTEFRRLCGVRVQFSSKCVDVVCNGDELYMSFEPDDLALARGKVYVAEEVVS